MDSEKQQYVGTYKNNQGNEKYISLNNDGELYYNANESYRKILKIDLTKKNEDGVILLFSSDEIECNDFLYPVGVKDKISNTKDKIRVLYAVGSEAWDVSVYYKVD